jgi:hypothetical protein
MQYDPFPSGGRMPILATLSLWAASVGSNSKYESEVRMKNDKRLKRQLQEFLMAIGKNDAPDRTSNRKWLEILAQIAARQGISVLFVDEIGGDHRNIV